MMRLLRIVSAGLYKAQFDTFFFRNVSLSASYEDALGIFRKQAMLYPSSFCLEMKKLGVDCEDIIPDFQPMQNLWKKQYGNNDDDNIFFQQIKRYRPDAIYFQELDAIPASVRKSLKQIFPFLKIVTGFKGFPPKVFADYDDLDHLFISYPHFQAQWEQVGVSTTILPHCFDPGTNLQTITPAAKTHDVTFLGSTGFGNLSQQGRYHDLKTIIQKTPLEIWGKEQIKPKPYYLIKGAVLSIVALLPSALLQNMRDGIKNNSLNLLIRDGLLVREKKIRAFDWYLFEQPLRRLFPDRFHSPVSGSAYLSIIGQSKISLNRHTDEPWEGGNIRTFEATGMGSCLLTDNRPYMKELFGEDEVVYYNSVQECIEKVQYLLSHESERAAIAEKGLKRVQRDHTAAKRCEQIKNVLEKMLV